MKEADGKRSVIVAILMGAGGLLATPAGGAVLYNNLAPNDLMAMATRPDSPGSIEIESADDFAILNRSIVNSASFIGLVVPGTAGGSFSVTDVSIEIYRVFPADSDVGRTSGPPMFSTPQVPTRVNSPSDVAFASRDSGSGELSFNVSTLALSFSAANSVQPGGIHPAPNQFTGGNGPITGQEVQFSVNFMTPFDLPADHYFFVPEVLLGDGAQFYWLSASRPISGAGTTPFAPDLQSWTRDAALDPDWLRVGTDIVGGTNAPTFNAAFALNGEAVGLPEPSTSALVAATLMAWFGRRRRDRGRRH